MSSSSNSKRSLNNLPKRLKNSRLRSKLTSARIVASLRSSNNKRMMQLVSQSVYLVLRSSAMTLWKRLYSSKKSLRSLNANASETGKNYLLCSTPTPPSFANVTSLNAWSFTSGALLMAKLTIWSTLYAL